MSRLAPRLRVAASLLGQLCKLSAWQRKKPDAPARILVLHHLLLGDSLMLTGLLAKLAEQYPQAQRFVACPQALAGLYSDHPFGVTALGWDPRSSAGLQSLFAAAPFDLVVIPAENRYSPLARALGARWVIGFAGDRPAWKNWLLDEAVPFPQTPRAFADFCCDLVSGAPPETYAPDTWPLPPGIAFNSPLQAYAVLHPGASTPLKYWPGERWLALADWFLTQGIQPVWSAGAKEKALVASLDPQGRFPSYAGQLDLNQLAQLYRQARIVVCPDTGVAHLARIVGVPTVALFGPGSSLISGAGQYWRSSPFVAFSHDIDCRNQDVTFRRHEQWIHRCARSQGTAPHQCPRPRCMEAIGLEEVQAACLQVMQAPAQKLP